MQRAPHLVGGIYKERRLFIPIKNLRHEWRDIEAFSLKAYRMRGTNPPRPQFYAPRGGGLNPTKGAVAFHVSAWI